MKLLSLSNSKTRKGESHGWITGILHLAPARLSGHNVCPMASAGCKLACLNSAGNGNYPMVQKARIRKTKLFFSDRAAFLAILAGEIASLELAAKSKGMRLAIRLNGTSDLPWETYGIMERFPNVRFYDYVKVPMRMHRYLSNECPPNYHLTFSRSESNEVFARGISKLGGNVAIVFRRKLPAKWWGCKVIDGDKTDLRFLDQSGVIVGLTAKGRGQTDKTGFVLDPDSDTSGALDISS